MKVLADLFRDYGIRVYLSVNFASPMAEGGLPTADPSMRVSAGGGETRPVSCIKRYPTLADFW